MDAKREMVIPNDRKLSIAKQCALLSLPRSSYYRRRAGSENPQNRLLMRMIDEEYTRHPFVGARQMVCYLSRNKHNVNRKRVTRLMQKMGLQSVAPKPNLSKANVAHKVYPYLLRALPINQADQVWCSDITYLRMPGGHVYLTTVMDWYSRRVLSWEVSVTCDDSFCVSALETAIRRHGTPEIFNTDQGSQYTGKAFTGVLKDHDIRISMDGKGRAMDNIMVERLWRTVKYEEIYLKDYESVLHLKRSLEEYFKYYNEERPHSSLGGQTPKEVHEAGQKTKVAA